MSTNFDPADYIHAPVITVSSGVALALALVDACPKASPANVKKARDRLKTTAEKARAQLAERNRALGVFTEEDSRALDNEADRAWGALRMRIQAMAMLEPKKFPKAKRAAEIDSALFSGGMNFLFAEYGTQSSRMAAILHQIDEDGLSADIDGIAGKDFLHAVRDIQPRYEAMVNERLRRDKATGQNMLETTRGLQAAIVNYASKIIGTIDDEEPDTVEAARVALLPIANHREAAAARAQRNAEPTAPTEPKDDKQPEPA